MSWIKTTLIKTLITSRFSNKQKEFGYLLSTVLFIALGLSIYKNGFLLNQTQIFITSGLVLILLFTFTIRRIFLPFLFLWLLIGEFLGIITSFLVMAVVYFMLFSPIALMIRCFRREKTYQAEWKMVTRKIDYKKLS
ncbi:hypothetical protein [Lacinutrix sp. Hel_I_90]|uniref:hypothetical protein n=1 Tax=Lacinutrix sp. Hel_I_90 TaxID=1249999 RepID=UPI0005C9BEC7|nr:hypothetical protein [Lacinutrix sp. Hel_I_90]